MEILEEVVEEEEFSASNDHPIVKRKRTKRPRQSYSDESHRNSVLVSSSPTTSTSTEAQDQDDEGIAANCLILLARSFFPPKAAAENKFSTRKLAEMGATTGTDGKVGGNIYVYVCKTCNRTFPSFQALGGHRASHKKPKSSDQIDGKKSPPPPPSPPADDNQQKSADNLNTRTTSPQSSTHLIEINKHKVHECSICGSEFASGQALGGHMRRHRPAVASAKISSQLQKTRPVLALDLNLPAPPEDATTEFHQFATNQKPHLGVFSAAPALVDCHY